MFCPKGNNRGRIIGRIKVNDIRTSRGEQQRHREQILFDTTVFII